MAKFTIRATPERRRQARLRGEGMVALAVGDDRFVLDAIPCPLLIDRLRAAGMLAPDLHDIALRARAIYERTSFRGQMTARYSQRVSGGGLSPEQEYADDRFRRLERFVLARDDRPAYQAFRQIAIEDRMSQHLGALARALRRAERGLYRRAPDAA